MTLEHKKNIFVELGKFLSQFSEAENTKCQSVLFNDLYFDQFIDLIQLSPSHNGWYTNENVYFAIQSWAKALTEDNLNQWLDAYDFTGVESKTVGLVLAGNIPLVGFHDFISVLLSGHKVVVKTSSNDQHLLPFLAKYLISVDPELENYITFVEGKLENFDAVIATGSNNTARYFEYYFKDKPSIIRKSRNSVAVLNGQETKEQMVALGEDVFRYFGLGCRNVSKLFIPEGFNLDRLFNAFYSKRALQNHNKYMNNYDYNRSVYLLEQKIFFDNGFLILKEDEELFSPVSVVNFEFYSDINSLDKKIKNLSKDIQCRIGVGGLPFGSAQNPNLWDYADGVDTLNFIIKN